MNEKEREQIERAAKAGFTLMEVMVAVTDTRLGEVS